MKMENNVKENAVRFAAEMSDQAKEELLKPIFHTLKKEIKNENEFYRIKNVIMHENVLS